MAASSFSPSPFLSSILGVNPTAGQPTWSSVIPVAGGSSDSVESILRAQMASREQAEDMRRQRQADWEEAERKLRAQREAERRERMEERLSDPVFLKMSGLAAPPPTPPTSTGPSPEMVQLQAAFAALQQQMAAEREARARDDVERRAREETARLAAEAEGRRRDAEIAHQRELDRIRAEAAEATRRSEAERVRAADEQRRSEERFRAELAERDRKHEEERRREIEGLKATVVGEKKPDFADALARLEAKFFDTQAREHEAAERRRIEEDARRQNETLRQELAEQRRVADQKHTELMLSATKPKDDTAMLTALGGIFGTTLKGAQDSSSGVLQAMTSIMESSRKANELPEWMGNLISKSTNRGEEMAQMAQASSQIMSVALGAVGQVLQHMAANNGESPWLRVAESFFQEVGSIGSALITRGVGGMAGAAPGAPALSDGQPAPKELPATTDAPVTLGDATVKVAPDPEIPEGTASVTAEKPVAPSQIVATRIQQLKGAIRDNKLQAKDAARAFVEMVEFEAAYSSALPAPLDQIGKDPGGVVEALFGEWLRQFKGADKYLATMKSWVERFVREGLPEEEEEEEGGEEEPKSAGKGEGEGEGEEAEVATEPVASPPAAPGPAERPPHRARGTKGASNGERSQPLPAEVIEAKFEPSDPAA